MASTKPVVFKNKKHPNLKIKSLDVQFKKGVLETNKKAVIDALRKRKDVVEVKVEEETEETN